MLYQLGESGSSSAISPVTLIFSGTETLGGSKFEPHLRPAVLRVPEGQPSAGNQLLEH
jgi:hypothetical protein